MNDNTALVPVHSPPPRPAPPPSSGFSLDGILYMLFRHKLKIAACTILGLAAGAVVYVYTPTQYVSEARLLVRYVTDAISTDPTTMGSEVRTPDSRGSSIINSEIEILTSRDLLVETVEAVGVDAFQTDRLRTALGLEEQPQDPPAELLAEYLGRSLSISQPRDSSVIRVRYTAANPALAQSVLRTLIEQYLRKHASVHRFSGAYDFLTQQTDQLRAKLAETEAELRKHYDNLGVNSLAEAKTTIRDRSQQIQSAILDTEATLAAEEARAKALRTAVTQIATPEEQTSESAAEDGEVTPARRRQYDIDRSALISSLLTGLRHLRQREVELLSTYTEDSLPVRQIRKQIGNIREQMRELTAASSTNQATFTAMSQPQFDDGTEREDNQALQQLMSAESTVASLSARLAVLRRQADQLDHQAERLSGIESRIAELERRKEIDAEAFTYFSQSLEHAKIDEALDATKIANIAVVQAATLPTLSFHNDRLRNVLLAFAVLAGAGIAWAFVTENFLDRSLRHPKQLEAVFRVPMLASFPISKRLHRVGGRKKRMAKALLQAHDEGEAQRWTVRKDVRDPYQTLCNQILWSHDVISGNGHTRLIGISGCLPGSGTSTIASGLAVTMAKSQDGSVLLADAGSAGESVRGFFAGKKDGSNLDVMSSTDDGTVRLQRNLALIAPGAKQTDDLPFSDVETFIDRVRGEGYAYVIFDMPPVSAASPAFRLLKHLDALLLVVASEQVKQAEAADLSRMIHESGVPLRGTILNKRRYYVPAPLRSS